MKKILVAILFAAVIASGAMAQLMFGVSGALHMDSSLTPSEIKARFDSGEGIFYGGFAEIAGKHIGLGVTANMSTYTGDANVSFTYQGYRIFGTLPNVKLVDYDITGYLSYHLFGARAFLDPFGEFGGGVIATGLSEKKDQDRIPWESPFLAASYYWYAALGAGLSLGPIGVFGKFSYNYPIKKAFSTTFKDTANDANGIPQPTYLSGSTELGAYGYDENLFPDGYLPKFRFTAGVKLIL